MLEYTKYILFGLVILLCIGCNSNSIAVDNPLEKEIDEIKYTLSYIPTSRLVKNEMKSKLFSFEEVSRRYEDHYYFKLNMKTSDGQNIIKKLIEKHGAKETDEILRLISFHSKDKLKLKINSHESSCVLYHVDRTFVELNGMEMTVVFKVDDMDMLLNNEFNTVAFKFENDIIENHQIEFLLDESIILELQEV